MTTTTWEKNNGADNKFNQKRQQNGSGAENKTK
jgi:hypothetical protein